MSGIICFLDHEDMTKLQSGESIMVEVDHVPSNLQYIQIQQGSYYSLTKKDVEKEFDRYMKGEEDD